MSVIYLALALGAAVWLALRGLQAVLLTYLGLLPFLTWLQIHYHNTGWTLVPSALLVLLAVHAIGLQTPARGRAAYGLAAVVILYAGLAAAQVFNPNLPSITLGVRGARLFLEPIILYFVGAEVARRPELRRRVITVIMITGAIVVAYAVKQGITGFDAKEAVYLRQTFAIAAKESRVIGTMAGASVLGHYLGLIVFLVGASMMHGRPRVREVILAAFCLYAILLTGQRGVMLSAMAGAAVLVWFGLARPPTRFRAGRLGQALTVVFFLAAVLAITTPVQDRRAARNTADNAFEAARIKFALLKEGKKETSLQQRLDLLGNLGEVADLAPWGVGTGFNLTVAPGRSSRSTFLGTAGFGPGGRETKLQPRVGDVYYYLVGSELGVVGLGLFVGIGLFAVAAASRVATRHPDRDVSRVAMAAGAFFVFVLVDGLSVDAMASAQVASYFWLFLGMVGAWRAEIVLPALEPALA